MAAAGTSPALNLREKLAELAGLKQRVSPDLVRCDFTNLVTNGGFDTDTDWSKGTGWTISGGVAVATTSTAILNPSPTNNLPQGRRYTSACVVASISAGTAALVAYDNSLGATIALDTSATTGTLSITFTASGAVNQVYLGRNGAPSLTATFDNIYIYEADPSDDAPWLRLPYGYKVGQRGMIVRDGVILHPSDYTEITDSGQTWIKPITAPGVSTEFSIWAGA